LLKVKYILLLLLILILIILLFKKKKKKKKKKNPLKYLLSNNNYYFNRFRIYFDCLVNQFIQKFSKKKKIEDNMYIYIYIYNIFINKIK